MEASENNAEAEQVQKHNFENLDEEGSAPAELTKNLDIVHFLNLGIEYK